MQEEPQYPAPPNRVPASANPNEPDRQVVEIDDDHPDLVGLDD